MVLIYMQMKSTVSLFAMVNRTGSLLFGNGGQFELYNATLSQLNSPN